MFSPSSPAHLRGARHRGLAAGVAFAILSLGLAACGGDDDDGGSTTQGGIELVKPGQLTVCTNLPYPPFQYEEGGEVVGFDVEVVDLIAEKLDVQQQVLDGEFETIQTGSDLNAGKCDVAAAAITITEEREENVDFSVPYFDATQALLATKGLEVTSIEDVTSQELRLGSQSNTTGEAFAKDNGANPKSYPDSGSELNGLRSGEIDVLIQDYPVIDNWLKTQTDVAENFELAATLDTGEQYGLVVKEDGGEELLELINETLEEAKQDGTWAELYQKWFDAEPVTTPTGTPPGS